MDALQLQHFNDTMKPGISLRLEFLTDMSQFQTWLEFMEIKILIEFHEDCNATVPCTVDTSFF